MTTQGVDFLEAWVNKNVPHLPFTGNVLVKALAGKLKADAGFAGFTMEDLEIDEGLVEKFISEAMLHRDEPGTPGD